MYDIPKIFSGHLLDGSASWKVFDANSSITFLLNWIKLFHNFQSLFTQQFTLYIYRRIFEITTAQVGSSSYFRLLTEWMACHAYLFSIIIESITISQSACNGSTGPDHRWSNGPEGMLLLPVHIRPKLSTFPEASTADGFVLQTNPPLPVADRVKSSWSGICHSIRFLTASGPVPGHEQLGNVCHKSAAVDWNRFVWDQWLLRRPPHTILSKSGANPFILDFHCFRFFTRLFTLHFDVSFYATNLKLGR